MRDVYQGSSPTEGRKGVGGERGWAVMRAQGQLSQHCRESTVEMADHIGPCLSPGPSTPLPTITGNGPPQEGCVLGPGGSD